MRGYSKMKMTTNSSPPKLHQDFPEKKSGHEEEEVEEEEKGGVVVLRRSFSSASHRYSNKGSENGTSTMVQAVVRRALSMRRPASVAEGYWRIHDHTGDGDGDEDEDVVLKEEEEMKSSSSKRKKGSRFIRVCKSLFKF